MLVPGEFHGSKHLTREQQHHQGEFGRNHPQHEGERDNGNRQADTAVQQQPLATDAYPSGDHGA
jgi:hypothetical protein